MREEPMIDRQAIVGHPTMRTSIHLPASMRAAIKHLAIDRDTTMGALIRAAIVAGLEDPAGLAAASMPHRRQRAGDRTTLDLPRWVHRQLKLIAAGAATSVQALILTAILHAHPDLHIERSVLQLDPQGDSTFR